MTTPTEVAGRYRLERRLGAGGMSTVFLALDTVLERRVAVKLLAEHLAEDEAFVARFRREALSAAKLQHPNIVQVFDSGQDRDSERHYIVMEFVEGPSCADLIREEKQLDVAQAIRYVVDACHGLDYAHRAGVVHRDVKPGNLLVSTEAGTLKLADFGIAKAAEQTRITQVGSVLGTAAYLSPEQARGEEAGPSSDIYSLGVCAYQFLAGRLPHEYGSLTELALKQQNDEVDHIQPLRPEIPDALDRAIRVALHVDPDQRYRSALEMAEAVAAGARGQDTDATLRLGAADYEDVGATRALPRTEYAQRHDPTMVAPLPARDRTPPPRRRARREPEPRRRSGGGAGRFLLALLLLAAGAAAAFAVVSADGGGIAVPNERDVQSQVQELKDLIREYSE
ncbi:MAG: eukaryotic-like serine/threonine-protein kinase [Thermoleophilaceae bacterium]|jgi:serine/threonine-protein kinase|nr:eukaryotic-like serine/threonine-protein kinase [Thermoleophilaceae bacterium]